MMYPRSLITPPAIEPVTLEEVKLHQKVDFTEDDDLINGWIVAAREYVEMYTRRALITQTWETYLNAFPAVTTLKVPLPPLQSVTHIKYTADGEAEATLASSNYLVDMKSEPGRIVLATDGEWPTDTLIPANGVTVRFVAGYGATDTAVPESIRSAIRLLAAHWYENREPVVIGTIASNIAFTIDALLAPYRVMEYQ